MGLAGIREAYETGRGRVVMRARIHTEQMAGGKSALIVTEMPYQVKRDGDDGVIKKIAELVNDKVIPEISDINNHSDRSGHPHHDRAQARRHPDGRAQQALQAHRSAEHVRGQHGGAGGRRSAGADAAGDDLPLPRPPEGGRHPAHQVPARQGGAPGARPRGLPDRARQPGRGDRADPRRRRRRDGAKRADRAGSACPRSRPRRSSRCACGR